MTFVVDVLITYRAGDVEEERTHALQIEQDQPPSRADVAAEVEAMAPSLVSRTGSPLVGGPQAEFTFTWEIQGVYEIP